MACVAIATFGLVGVLYVHTTLAKDAYRLHDAERTAATLKAQEESLAHQVDSLNDPGSIAAKAASLGMVPGESPVFITPDGKTLGAALPNGTKLNYPTKVPGNGLIVVAKPTPTPTPASSPQTSPKPSGSPSTGPTPSPSTQ